MCRKSEKGVWYVYLCGMLTDGWTRLGPGTSGTLLGPGCTHPLCHYLDQI